MLASCQPASKHKISTMTHHKEEVP